MEGPKLSTAFTLNLSQGNTQARLQRCHSGKTDGNESQKTAQNRQTGNTYISHGKLL